MKPTDRKLAWSAIVIFAVIAVELGWFLVVGPGNQNPYFATECRSDCDIPWWRSPELWTAAFTGVLTWSTIRLWLETKRLARGAEDQARDIQEQLNVARDDFVSTHRPWLSHDLQILPPGIIINDSGVTVTFQFVCQNHGTSPALSASINAEMGLWHPLRHEIEALRQICSKMHAPPDAEFAWGIGVMPSKTEPFNYTYVVPRDVYDAYVAAGQPVLLCLAGCIDYGFSFGKPAPHQTGFVYYIGAVDLHDGSLKPIPPADGVVPVPHVFLTKSITAGAFFAT